MTTTQLNTLFGPSRQIHYYIDNDNFQMALDEMDRFCFFIQLERKESKMHYQMAILRDQFYDALMAIGIYTNMHNSSRMAILRDKYNDALMAIDTYIDTYRKMHNSFQLAILRDECNDALMAIDTYMKMGVFNYFNSPTKKPSKIIDDYTTKPIINKGDETKRRKQNTRRVIQKLNMRKNNTNRNRRN